MKNARFVLPALVASLVLGAAPARAAWPKLPTENLAVRNVNGMDIGPVAVEDGAGGLIIVTSPGGFFAQHVLASGSLDPAWPAAGLSLGSIDGVKPAIASDGSGGAIVTWEDYRSAGPLRTNPDIYAAHILPSGIVDPLWPVNGLAVCTAPLDQLVPTLVPDGAGGAVIAWQDNRVFYDVYAQHVLASGTVDPAWPVNGRALCTATDGQGSQSMVSDGAGGAIVAWHDFRSHTNWDVYAQHVLASGAVDAAWPVDGRALCTAVGHQTFPVTVADGAGGAILTWEDRRAGPFAVYAQHVSAGGVADPSWPANGVAVSVANAMPTGIAARPRIASDDAGGAIVTWQDDRTMGTPAIYAQHLPATGGVDLAWPVNGLAVCPYVWTQMTPVIAADGAHGAIIAWLDLRASSSHIYAMRVTPSGGLDPAWQADGRAVGTADMFQDSLCVVPDGNHGVLLAWRDFRSDGFGHFSYGGVYAQRLWSDGQLGPSAPVITSVVDVPADQGGFVTLHWDASYYDPDPLHDYTLTQYTIWRLLPPVAQQAAARGDHARYRATRAGAQTLYWEVLGAVPATGASAYQYTASTFSDFVSPPPPNVTFMVIAEAPTAFWLSAPDSGYSIDNLAPPAPLALQSFFTGTQAQLHWQPVVAPDLKGYRVYVGSTPDFPVDMDHFVGQTSGTSFTNAAEIAFHYRVTAVDLRDNESASTLLTLAILGVGPGTLPTALALDAPRPNPAALATSIRFALPAAAPVRLAVYDASGREVRVLVDGTLGAGERSVPWDLRDGGGHGVGAGLYFVRLVAAGQTRVQRAVVTR